MTGEGRHVSPRRVRLQVATVVAAVAIMTGGVGLLRETFRTEVGPLPAAFAAYAAVIVPAMMLDAVVLALRAHVLRSLRSALLAAAFFVATPFVLANLLTLPDIGLPAGLANSALSAWFFGFWHLSWLGMLAVYAWCPPWRYIRAGRLAVATGVALGVVGFMVALHGVPGYVRGADEEWAFGRSAYGFAGIAIVLCGLILARLASRGEQPLLDRWLIVAVAIVYGSTLTIFAGGGRFSLGAYAGRAALALDALLVLIAVGADYLRHLRRSLAGRRLAEIAEALPVIVLVLDPGGACTYVNRNWVRVTGQPREHALGSGYQQRIAPDDVRALRRYEEDIRDEPALPDVELRLQRPNGEWRWFQLRVTAMRRADESLEGWLGVASDIEERVRATSDLREALDTARHVADALEQAFLPASLPSVAGVSLRAAYRPANPGGPIGGDWYDLFQLADGRLAIIIGDVTGHGLSASAQMVRLRETLRAAAAFEAMPDRILARANAAVCLGRPLLASALVGILDPQSLTFVFASAGHPAPVLVREGRALALPSGGALLGVDAEVRYATHGEALRVGDRLVLYTDGLIEAGRDVVAGEALLHAALAAGILEPAVLVNTVAGDVLADDIALVTLELTGAPVAAPRAPWRFLSDDALIAAPARASFTAYLRRQRVDEANIAAAEIVFGEMVGNVVRHAPGAIEIEVFWSDVPAIVVRDRGPGFELRETEPDLLSEGGRGVFLMRSLGALLEVRARPGGGSEVVAKLPTLRSAEAVRG